MKLILTYSTISIAAGWSFGILVGSFDAIVRIHHLLFEWTELYQCLLLPALIFAVVYFAAALVISIISHLFTQQISDKTLRFTFRLVSFAIVIALVVGRQVYLGSLRQGTDFWLGVLGPLIFAVALLQCLAMMWRRGYFDADSWASQSWKRVQNVFSSFVYIATVMVVFCFVYDLYLLQSRPSIRQTSNVTTDRPNVVLVTLDTVRAQSLSLYGYSKPTSPALDALASRAVVFEEAISSSPWTLPAHASIFTGKWIFRHGAHMHHQQLTEQHTTLAELLSQQGYVTAGFVGGPYVKRRYGTAQGFQHYNDRLDFFEYHTLFDRFSIVHLMRYLAYEWTQALFDTDGERIAPEINADIEEWFDELGASPFFLFVNYFDAHAPYVLGEEYRGEFTQAGPYPKGAIRSLFYGVYDNKAQRYEPYELEEDLKDFMRGAYDAEIRYLDHHFNEFIDMLRERDLLENTLLIITSDHGEEFFEHGGVQHRQTLFREVLRVPLMVYYPSRLAPRRVTSPVSTVNIFPTVLDILGMNVPEGIDSFSLVPLMEGNVEYVSNPILSELHGQKYFGGIDLEAVQVDRKKLILVSEEKERVKNSLFDHEHDPEEQQNSYHQATDTVTDLSRVLESMKSDVGGEVIP